MPVVGKIPADSLVQHSLTHRENALQVQDFLNKYRISQIVGCSLKNIDQQ